MNVVSGKREGLHYTRNRARRDSPELGLAIFMYSLGARIANGVGMRLTHSEKFERWGSSLHLAFVKRSLSNLGLCFFFSNLGRLIIILERAFSKPDLRLARRERILPLSRRDPA